MSSRSRNFRKKVSDGPTTEGEALGGDGTTAAAAAAPPPQKPVKKTKKKSDKAGKGPGLLSFEGDEEEGDGPELQLKKSKPKKPGSTKGSSKSGKLRVDLPNVEGTQAQSQQSAAGEYTADKLRALQKNAISISTATLAPPQEEKVPEPLIKLSGSFKPASVPGSAPPQQEEDTDMEESMPLPPPPKPPSGIQSAAAEAIDADEDDDSFIPDAETIRKAKEKRERLRRAHGAQDYISMHDAGQEADLERAARQGGSGGGDSDSDDEAGNDARVQFLGGTKKGASGPGVLSAAAAPVMDNDDHENDDDSFVAEQIRKGTGGASMYPSIADTAVPQPKTQRGFALGGGGVSEQASAVMASLQQQVARLTDKRRITSASVSKTKQQLKDSVSSVANLEAQLEAAKLRFTDMQEIKAYMADLCDCLQDKSAIVDVLEGHVEEAVRARADAAAERRRLEAEETAAPLEAAVLAALHALGQGASTEEAAQSAAAAEAAAREELQAGLGEDLDEFGRDLNVQKRKDAQKRAGRRERRRQVLAERQRKAAAAGLREAAVGESASEESEDELDHYRRRRAEVSTASETAFKDADDDFSSVAAVKKRLESFKARHPGQYQQAYVPASAPALFAPYVRLEVLRWDLLKPPEPGTPRRSFDTHEWYTKLFDYGMGEGCSGDEDEDNELVPQLVAKVVLPAVTKALEHGWDARNPGQTAALRATVADLLVYVDPRSQAVADLAKVVLERLREAAASCRLQAWPSAAAAACPAAAEVQARSFGALVRVSRNIGAWEGLVARQPLLELALRQLGSQALPYIRSAGSDADLGVERLQRLMAAVPSGWLPEGGPAPREAAPLAEMAESLARSVESKRTDGPWKEARPRVAGALARILTSLGAPDRAAAMSYLAHM